MKNYSVDRFYYLRVPECSYNRTKDALLAFIILLAFLGFRSSIGKNGTGSLRSSKKIELLNQRNLKIRFLAQVCFDARKSIKTYRGLPVELES